MLPEGTSEAHHHPPPRLCNLQWLLSAVRIQMQLPKVACMPPYPPTLILTPQAPESSVALFQALYLLQSLLPQGLCSGCSHHLGHSPVLIQPPSTCPHIPASDGVLRRPLTSLMGPSPYHLLLWCLWVQRTCYRYCIFIWVILFFISAPSSAL